MTKVEIFDKILSNMKDYHLPALLAMFGAGAFMTWFHHLDATFVGYTSIIVGAITGHAIWSPGQKGDSDDTPPSK